MKKLLIILVLLCSFIASKATHNRAGEITYRYISGLTYEISVTIYADPSSPAFQRTEVEVDWGDNTSRDSLQNPSLTTLIPNVVSKRVWTARHTFPGAGNYTISVTDLNRNGGVDNITNSSSVAFYIESQLLISSFGNISNNSPVLLNDPIDDACVGEVFIHNPGAYDEDGDSLAYRLAKSREAGGLIANGFYFPSASISLSVNQESGDLIWNTPEQPGLYNLAIRVLEYRNGQYIGSVLRDIQVEVKPGCNNKPPTITLNRLICVEANNTLNEIIQANDVNGDEVTLTASGEPLELSSNPAVFIAGNPSSNTIAQFNWNPNCNQVRIDPYRLSVKATDDAETRGGTNLTSFENMDIRVIAPAPENYTAQANGKNINLSWDESICKNAIGYHIYRRFDSSGFVPSQCQLGVPEFTGHEKIATINNISTLSYIDSNGVDELVPGRKYCYFITAYFSDGDESYASREVCAEIEKYVPIITNVSVSITDPQGEIELAWSPPDTIDSQMFPPPYFYNVYRFENGAPQLIGTTPTINDTTFVVSTINTVTNASQFMVELVSQSNGTVGNSPRANSIYLSLTPNDNRIALNWSDETPWKNYSYTVYRQNSVSQSFDSIGTTVERNFIDDSLINGKSYCYYIESKGKYDLNSIKTPLINLSQQNCSTPIDNEPPCSPNFDINSSCDSNSVNITWRDSLNSCSTDIVKYRLYKSLTQDSKSELLTEILISEPKRYASKLNSIAGCYKVVSVDSSGNESNSYSKKCVDYCPRYELPNIFTPNGDFINDEFVPLPNYRYVDSIDLKVYNRWGRLVFETNDPAIEWDAKDMRTERLVEAGTYYYTCMVFELSLEGLKPRIIKGTVSIHDPSKINSK